MCSRDCLRRHRLPGDEDDRERDQQLRYELESKLLYDEPWLFRVPQQPYRNLSDNPPNDTQRQALPRTRPRQLSVRLDPYQPADEREMRYGKEDELPRVRSRSHQRAVERLVVGGEDEAVNQHGHDLRDEERDEGRQGDSSARHD